MNSPAPRPVKGADKPAPYNASDPEQIHDREKKAKRREDLRKEGLKFIMSDARGRSWMRHLIGEKLFTRIGNTRPAAIFTGNSSTFYNAALKEVGDIISTELATLTPAEFRLLEDEANEQGA